MSDLRSIGRPLSRLLPKLRGSTALISGTVLAMSLPPNIASAQQATPLPPVSVETLPGPSMPFGGTTLSGDSLMTPGLSSDDSASQLSGVPGVALFSAGGVSGLPTIHGLADDRVLTEVNGVPITATCPNHMNPPLSYIPPSAVGSIDVFTGLSPVSRGGDSIGSTIQANAADPVFATGDEGVVYHGYLSSTYRSGDSGIGASGGATAATGMFSIGYDGAWAQASDYRAGDGGPKVLSTEYQAQNHVFNVAANSSVGLFQLRGGIQDIPYQGFPNQWMDMTSNQSHFIDGHYQGSFDWGNLDATVYWRDVDHQMALLSDKIALDFMYMPMNETSTSAGYSVKAELPVSSRDTIRVGNEFHYYRMDDWWPPVAGTAPYMGPETFVNINGGTRDRLGTFAEWEAQWTPTWSTLLGVRNDTVWMDTGNVQGYSTFVSPMMGSLYAADADRFNGLNHQRTDVNFDVTAESQYEPTDTVTLDGGYARKTRSPNLYERYSWSTLGMSASEINWFGDGNNYVGNINLKPEVANSFSASAGWHDPTRKSWDVKLTPYVSYIQDYISVVPYTGPNPTGSQDLTFANRDAIVYGFDVSGRARVWSNSNYGDVGVSGVAGWVRGYTVDNGVDLYHLMPLNAKLGIDHSLGGWKSGIEVQLVDSKTNVDTIMNEPATAGYALVNFHTSYTWENVTLSFGVDNLFDKAYYQPLGGVYLERYAANNYSWGGINMSIPGPGRSVNAGLTVRF